MEEKVVDVTSTNQEESKEVVKIDFKDTLGIFSKDIMGLGQLCTTDESTESLASFSVARFLSNGGKQFFKIRIEEVESITLTK